MEKTADLAMVQKTNIDALHKEGKSQRVITERRGSSQSAVLKHIKCKAGSVTIVLLCLIGQQTRLTWSP